MASAQDRELQQYRDLVPVPDRFESGFGIKMLVAAVFLGFLMVPASIYLSLFMGGSMGTAAQWVTVILFAEVAKRSMKGLKSQEIFLLFYMTGVALSGQVHGGILSQLLWNQYLVQSPAMISMGVADAVPEWVAPSRHILQQSPQTFLTQAWMAPVAFIVGTMIIQRIDQFGLGYAMYRLAAHVEKLPFPMAPVAALGITAMAEGEQDQQKWRWRCFSLGGMIGMTFGAIYVGLPAITGALFGTPIQIIPIPWLDFTAAVSTENFLPAVPMSVIFDVGLIILGMVLPFWAVVGGFLGVVVTIMINPVLYRNGVLTGWQPGMGVVDTFYQNYVDFYLSLSIGLAGSVFLISLGAVLRPLLRMKFGASSTSEDQATRRNWREFVGELFHRNRERGDLPILISLAIYLFSATAYIVICMKIVPGFTGGVALFFAGFAFIYQPAISYVNTKLEGMVGQTVQIPLLREAAFIFSGYSGAAIWFAPIPLSDYSSVTRNFRVMELTGTRLTDIIKVELLTVPILLVCSFMFCELIWRLAPIPSEVYPYTQEVWDLQARLFALQVTATSEGTSQFLEAVKFDVIGYGLTAGLLVYGALSAMNLPTLLLFGAIRGLGSTLGPGAILFEIIGALAGKFYLEKRFGHQNFKRYVMVLFAGYSAGVGLIAMAAVAIAWIVKSTTPLGY